MTPYHHALSSAKKYGGDWSDYIDIHHWFDSSKAHYADFRHRALRHHSAGIFECEEKFGKVFYRASDGALLPTRLIGEQHVKEDCGFIPTLADWFKHIQPEPWMLKVAKKPNEL